ncbi:hypothetical protein [Acidovorax sp. BL-A-41-H1]|uniref:hypothetical protein n=1 Tax=Acidovorax sp. BL-A-41-H1 TaxID=3421102 RepID=UPI003F78CA39
MTCSTTPQPHKRGASFDELIVIPSQFADGYFADFTPASQVRTLDGTLVANLTCEWVDPVTTRALRLTCLDTTAWPIGPVLIDARFKRAGDGYVISTTSAQLIVVKDVTREVPTP